MQAKDRGHFLAISARAMRQVIADAARRRTAEKRGGQEDPIPLDEAPQLAADQARWLRDVFALRTIAPTGFPSRLQCHRCDCCTPPTGISDGCSTVST